MAILRRRQIEGKNYFSGVGVTDTNELYEKLKEQGGMSFPIDLEKVIKLSGLKVSVLYEPMSAQHSGYLKNVDGDWVIGINSLHHPNRQRFTLAHELGHYILHRKSMFGKDGFEDDILFRADGYGSPGVERQANEFAADLLMPEDEFKKKAKDFSGSVSKLAEYFAVSALAVKVRASEL